MSFVCTYNTVAECLLSSFSYWIRTRSYGSILFTLTLKKILEKRPVIICQRERFHCEVLSFHVAMFDENVHRAHYLLRRNYTEENLNVSEESAFLMTLYNLFGSNIFSINST